MANYKGLAVGAFGGSQLWQNAVGNDALTITAITAGTADFLVCETAGGGEVFIIDDEGNIENDLTLINGLIVSARAGDYLRFSGMPTTAPTTGLTRGDFFVHAGNTNMGLAICISTANQTLRYITADTSTFGRDTLS